MNTTIDITEIISIVITLLGAIITAFVIPYIRSKTNDAQYNLIKTIVNTAVYFAESFFKAYGQGEKKRAYVFEYVQEKCKEIGVAFDEVAVLQMIEEAWIGLSGGVSEYSQITEDADVEDEGEIVLK
jgi:LL-H family phage holin